MVGVMDSLSTLSAVIHGFVPGGQVKSNTINKFKKNGFCRFSAKDDELMCKMKDFQMVLKS